MKHSTRSGYLAGCRCTGCKEAQRTYQQRYRERKANGTTRPCVVSSPSPEPEAPTEPGPVELATQEEINGLAPTRPLAAIALAMARILDSPSRVVSAQPAAAKVLVTVLDKLHSASARGSRGGLAVVRTTTDVSSAVSVGPARELANGASVFAAKGWQK
jgi:hypothetical protein